MSSSTFTRRIALIALLGLSACGFAPLLGDAGMAQGAFELETDDSVVGFRMRTQLLRRLGAGANPQFMLRTTSDLSQRAAAISDDGDTSRLNVIGSTDWSVTDIAGTRQIAGGTVEAFTSYSATGSTVATQTARDDAHARLAIILADMIVTRVSVAIAGSAQ